MVRRGTAASWMVQTRDCNRPLEHNSNLQLGGAVGQEKVSVIIQFQVGFTRITRDLMDLTIMGLILACNLDSVVPVALSSVCNLLPHQQLTLIWLHATFRFEMIDSLPTAFATRSQLSTDGY